MSLTRRLAAAVPIGIAAFAALAFGGSPASAATTDNAAAHQHPAVMVTPSCLDARSHCGYGYGHGTTTAPGGTVAPTRGHSGYTVSPTTSPPTSPTAHTNTVPPHGVSPTTVPPHGVSPTEVPSPTQGAVSGGNLPLTGAPMGPTMGVGGLMVAAGGAAVWYTRRRRTA
jgi:hypothetical protein